MDFSKVKTIGRTYLLDDKLFMNFSGSGVIFKMKGNKLIIKLFATKYDNDTNRPYISVIINEVRKDYALTEEHNIIEINLTDQLNTVEILKRTESSVSFVAIEDIIVDEFINYEFMDKLKIEFFGDSITCGYGNLCDNPEEGFTTKTESFLEGYAYLTTKKLDALYSAICVSGFPIYKARWNLSFPIESVADMLSISAYSEELTLKTAQVWDNSQYIPDVVVVNLGTNDCSYFTEGQSWVDELVKEYNGFENVLKLDVFKNELNNLRLKIISFLDNLFKMYKDVKVVWALGMLEINPHVQEVFDEALKNYNNPNLYQFTFTSLQKSSGRGAAWHPSSQMHIDASNELSEFIKDVVLGGVK